jgi:two-component system, chemotaxis family, response regulator Rcp1
MSLSRNGTQLEELLDRMVPQGSRPVEILLVEDNPGDVRIAIEALKDCRVPNNLNVAEDGVEAIRFLHGQDGYSGAPRPDLILLDLNLPRKDGHQVLAEIKTDESLCKIPVIVLTTSENERDVYLAYDLNANCYVTKPSGLDQLVSVMQSIHYFWSG